MEINVKSFKSERFEKNPNRLIDAVQRYGIILIEHAGAPAAVALSPDVYKAFLVDQMGDIDTDGEGVNGEKARTPKEVSLRRRRS